MSTLWRGAGLAKLGRPGPVKEALWAALVLSAALCLAYGNVVFAGRSLLSSNALNPFDRRLLETNYGPGVHPQEFWSERNLSILGPIHDTGSGTFQWEPGGRFIRRALLSGDLPLWNPYVGAGTPDLANLIDTPFFPPYLMVILLGSGVGLRNLYALALLLQAGVFTWLLLRRRGLSRVAAAAGGLSLMFTGALTQNIGDHVGQAAASLPAALWLTDWWHDDPSLRRSACLALGYAVVALASFPPVTLMVFGAVAIYAVVLICLRSGSDERLSRSRFKGLATFAVVAALGAGLVMFVYAPALALVRATPQLDLRYHDAGLLSASLKSAPQFLSPRLVGGPEVWGEPPIQEPGPIHVFYLGMVTVFLAVLGRPGRAPTKPLWWGMVLILALALLKLFGLPPVQWIGGLSGLSRIHFAHYIGAVIGPAVALLSALGIERLFRGGVRRLEAFAMTGLIMGFVAGGWWIWISRISIRAGAVHWRNHWLWLCCLAMAIALLAALATAKSYWAPRASWSIAALLAAEGIVNTWYPRQPRFDVWSHPPAYVRAILDDARGSRVFSIGSLGAPVANSGAALGLLQLDSLMGMNPPRIFQVYQRYVAPHAYEFMREAELVPSEGILDRAAIGLVVVKKYPDPKLIDAMAGRAYRVVFDDDCARIYRRESSPRFLFSCQFRVVPESQALDTLGTMPQGREVLLESDPGLRTSPNSGDDPNVAVTDLRINRYTLTVDAPRPGLVYMADSFAPGWTATVNGKPATILPANVAFRAVAVPAGPAQVDVSYQPPGWRAGCTVSAASLAAIVGLAVAGRPRRGQAKDTLTTGVEGKV